MVIVGKIDGISSNGKTLVETKQRRNCFFECIPVYEKVQLECYLWLTGIEQAIHVQNYNGEQKHMLYKSDPVLWSQIQSRLEAFVKSLM